MERIILAFIFLVGDFNFVFSLLLVDTPTLGSNNAPRLLSKDSVKLAFDYQELQNHTVLFYKHGSEEMYVGGTDFVLRVDTNNYHILEKYDLKAVGQEQCQEFFCPNIITVIEEFDDSLFVCGTNGHNPQCWKLYPSKNMLEESCDGTGISPFIHSQNSLSLTVEGDLYAAASLDSDGSSLQFRRKSGKRTNVWMYDNWVSGKDIPWVCGNQLSPEPTFISASWVKRENDSDNEKIYVFFREKNSDNNPEADPWISRVARVCKVDEGGSKQTFQNMWTSFLKARLVCGFPEESLYFNRLQDLYVLHDNDWNNTRIYAIYTSSWNSTAVCIYTIGMIEAVFENSAFKGYDKEIPSPRPGTCVKNSKLLPLDTIRIIRDHPEMANWVHSVHYKAPFYVSNYNYTKIAVDRVRAADNNMYNVLLLATDSGKIHKVLEAGSEPFIISEIQLPSHSAILSMKLDPKKKTLVVGFSKKISTVDLQKCEEYNKSCEDCVLARDPYCAWTEAGMKCTKAGVLNGTQNVMTGNPSVCPKTGIKQVIRTKREELTPSPSGSSAIHSVPIAMPFYLSCPIDSYHAEYSWKHGDHNIACLQMKSNCLHLIDAMSQENYGNYQCISKEKDYLKVVKEYHLTVQNIIKPDTRVEPHNLNNALQVVPQAVWLTFGLAVAML